MKFTTDQSISFCVGKKCPDRKESNADRIRSMTDDELAEMLSEPFPYNCARQKCNYYWKTCKECALDWLRQEAVDNGARFNGEPSGKVQDGE